MFFNPWAMLLGGTGGFACRARPPHKDYDGEKQNISKLLSGADPLVRAGPPGPALHRDQNTSAKKPPEGSAPEKSEMFYFTLANLRRYTGEERCIAV